MADDQADIKDLVQSCLQEVAPGVELLQVSNGQELILALTTQAVDEKGNGLRLPTVVLLDVNMPVKGGFEALAEIRANPLLRRVPVMGFTVSTDREEIGHMYDLGVNAFLTKPAGYKELCEMLSGTVAFWFDTAHAKDKGGRHPVS